MNCCAISNLYVRHNLDVACHDDFGEPIILGRVQSTEQNWSIRDVIDGALYNHIKRSLQAGNPPWPGTCENCAGFRRHEAYRDGFAQKTIFRLQVEPSLACNLKCPCCSQSKQILERPKPYRMDIGLFESLLRSLQAEGFTLREIEYCGQGEALIHPQFNEFVDVARALFPDTTQRLITNGNFDWKRSKISTAIDEIFVSCDGARQASYEQYRRGGSLARVFQFMRDISPYVGDRKQNLIWKYILFEFNDSDEEIIEAQQIAEKMGIHKLLFVFTHSLYKSTRYTAKNYDSLPIVWARAFTEATPIHYQNALQFIPETQQGWPIQLEEITATIDDVIMIGDDWSSLHGWILSEHKIETIRLSQNGAVLGESAPDDPRPDVRHAYPRYDGGNPGFSFRWKSGTPDIGDHDFTIDALDIDGRTVGSLTRRFSVSL